MEIIVSSILEQILAIGGVILAALVAAGIRYVFARIKNDKLRSYGDLLAFYAERTVRAVTQEQADALKEASSDGKLTDEEKKRLKAVAVDTLRSIVPDAVLAFTKKGKSDLDMLLSTLIESAVKDSKEVRS